MTLWHYLILYNVQQQKHKSDIPDLLSTREREGDMATAHRDGLSDSPEHYYENVDRNNIQGSIIFSNPDLASTIGKGIPSSLNVSPLCRSTKICQRYHSNFFQPMEMDSLTAETIAGLTTEEDLNCKLFLSCIMCFNANISHLVPELNPKTHIKCFHW